MSRRFFSQQPIQTDFVTLEGPETQHMLRVMRLTVDDQVELFDGSGWEFAARIAETDRNSVVLEVVGRAEVDRELPFHLTLAVSLPKGDRQRWLVEKATELGVTEIIPLQTERGVAQPTAGAIERLKRATIEACKQCGRNRLVSIRPPIAFSEFVSRGNADAVRLLAHPGGVSLRGEQSYRIATNADDDQQVIVGIGPEGGFTDQEVRQAVASGWKTVGLGPRTLRVETAAVALAAALSELA